MPAPLACPLPRFFQSRARVTPLSRRTLEERSACSLSLFPASYKQEGLQDRAEPSIIGSTQKKKMMMFLVLCLARFASGEPQAGGRETVFVHSFTDGRLDPELEFLGPVKSGGHIIANTAPGCWGPMITPHLKGGHEVTMPVAVAGAAIGDSVAIKIKNIEITSLATASGNDYWVDGKFKGDPYCAAYFARKDGTGEFFPETYVDGIGEDAIKFVKDDSPASPFRFANVRPR